MPAAPSTESANASRIAGYDIGSLDALRPETHQTVHGGYDPTFPVRDLDSSRVGYVAAPGNWNHPLWNCVDCSVQGLNCSDGTFGHEVHCEGEIYGQAQWDLAGLMTAKHGFNTGWQDLERIYFVLLPQADTMNPGFSGNVYDAYLAVDDDNGNLADGTPNCLEIFTAFAAHGIAGTSCGASTSGCSRPAEPIVTPTAASNRTWPGARVVTNRQFRFIRILRALLAVAALSCSSCSLASALCRWWPGTASCKVSDGNVYKVRLSSA